MNSEERYRDLFEDYLRKENPSPKDLKRILKRVRRALTEHQEAESDNFEPDSTLRL